MNLDKIRNYINFVINKDQLGEPQSPQSFNVLLPVVSLEKYELEYEKWLKTRNSDTPLIRFRMKSTPSVADGEVSKPDDYMYFISLLVEDNDVYKVVTITDPATLDNMRFNLLEQSPVELPAGTEMSDRFLVYPNPRGRSNGELKYFRSPVEPYYDTCIDSIDNEIYMPVGSYIFDRALTTEEHASTDIPELSTDGSLNLYSSADVLLTSNVSKSGVSGFYRSLSVELDWDETEHLSIAEMIVARVGRKDGDQYRHQSAEMETKK